MLRVHCQACGRFADAVANEKHPAIVVVRIDVHGFDVGKTPCEADLCLRCLARLRARFFGVVPTPADENRLAHEALMGPPAMPRFLEGDLPDPAEVAAE